MDVSEQTIKRTIEGVFIKHGISSEIIKVDYGPAFSRYTVKILSKIVEISLSDLSNDIALATDAPYSVRIEEFPEKEKTFGIEIPNKGLRAISFDSILKQYKLSKLNYKLPVLLGVDVENKERFADLVELENIVIAGTTGSGKSTFNHVLINTLISKYSSKELKMYLADPKRVELLSYKILPHLIDIVHIELDNILHSLGLMTVERKRREILLEDRHVKSFDEYNSQLTDNKLPYIVIIIDTFSDMMAYAPIRFENYMSQILSDSTTYGMHTVICDSRPSVDVFTEKLMKLFPTRIAFNTSSIIDSRVSLGQAGAEKLLGRGDMLFLPENVQRPIRIQGAYISENEIEKIINRLRV